jgi:hypothetical protein
MMTVLGSLLKKKVEGNDSMKKKNNRLIFTAISMVILFAMISAAFAATDQFGNAADNGEIGSNISEGELDSTQVSSEEDQLTEEDKEKEAETVDQTDEESKEQTDTDKSESDSESQKKETTSKTSSAAGSSTTSTPAKTENAASKTESSSPKPEETANTVEASRGDTSVKLVSGAYVVATNGSDSNPGTPDKPWKTIQKAADTLKAGDTVYIRGGTYNERVVLKNSGSSGNYITFMNYPGEKPVIDGKGIDWGYNWNGLVNINSKSYIKLSGLRIVNSRWAGFASVPDSSGSSNVQITNSSTYNTQASGIVFMNASSITIAGNSIEKACVSTAGSQEGISLENVNSFVVRSNKVFNFTNNVQGKGGEGIDAKQGSSNGKIYSNTVYNIPKIGIYVDSYKKASSNIEVYGNNVYNCGLGIAVAAEKGGSLKNVNIYGNTLKNNKGAYTVAGWNYDYASPMDNIRFNNNTISGGNIRLNNPDATNVYVTNNKISGGTIVMDGGIESETTIEGNTIN